MLPSDLNSGDMYVGEGNSISWFECVVKFKRSRTGWTARVNKYRIRSSHRNQQVAILTAVSKAKREWQKQRAV